MLQKKFLNQINYDENIFYIIIAYLTKFRDDYSIYMNSTDETIKFDIEKFNN